MSNLKACGQFWGEDPHLLQKSFPIKTSPGRVKTRIWPKWQTRWWFQIFFYFHPYLGRWSNLTNIFQMGWNHQLVLYDWNGFNMLFWLVGQLEHI